MARSGQRYDIEYVGFVTGDGGDALQMLQLAAGMQRLGKTVRIVVPASEKTVQFAKSASELGVPCLRSPLLRADTWGPKQSLPKMVTLARSLSAPTIHFHTGNSCLPRTLMIALLLTRTTRAFVTVHSPYETIDATSSRGKFWGQSARRSLHSVVTPSDHASAFQRDCGAPPSRVATIRNAIDLAEIRSGDGEKVRTELGLTPSQPLIVFTSRIDGQKRPLDAVRILSKVVADHPDTILAFIGSGDETDAVVAEAERLDLTQSVKVLGFRTDVVDWLAASTIWLLPTERENFSVAVLEALAAGCAVVTTECPGNNEIIVDGENALSFEVGDVDGGAAAVQRLLSDASLRAHLADGARASTTEFSVEAMVGQYNDLYARFTTPGRS